MKEVRQCSSCGGFCKKSGCERENVKPEPSKAELMAGIALQLREIERLREPLTDEQIHDCFQQRHMNKATQRRMITRAIEAHHGIGGGGK